jgi:heme-degrading monooxygenase HmoA
MIVVVFRSRLRENLPVGYDELGTRMMALAESMPGFISYKAFANDDGERVSIQEWESERHLRAWREHPEHVIAQSKGQESYYSEYTLYVLENPRESRFTGNES